MAEPTCTAYKVRKAWGTPGEHSAEMPEQPVRITKSEHSSGGIRLDFFFADGSELVLMAGRFGPSLFWSPHG